MPASASPLPAKVVSLRVRPFGVSHLCFETDGILGNLNFTLNPSAAGLLGATAPAFDFDLFYGILGSMPTLPASGSITFTLNPEPDTIIVLNGSTWRFVGVVTLSDQLAIASTLAETLAGAVKVLEASNDANTKKFRFSASATVLHLTAATGGPGGDTLTVSTTVPGATTSGPTLSGSDSSRLLYDFTNIQAEAAPFTLATLRAEPRKAALNKAIALRQNAYFAKYANKDAIVGKMTEYYLNPPDLNLPGPVNVFSKSARLDSLSDTNERLWSALNGAYANVGRQGGAAGVVDGAVGTLKADITSYGYEATGGQIDQAEASGNVPASPMKLLPPGPPDPWPPPTDWPPPLPPWTKTNPSPIAPPSTTPNNWAGNWNWYPGFTGGAMSASFQKSSSYELNSNNSLAHQDQTITNTDKVFRHPFYEAMAKYQRAQISLVDQQFAAYMYEQNLPHLGTVFDNELSSIDADVYRLQIAYLNTILMSPIPGVVTGVYKNPGEAVRAGEPVLRVENYAVILLEASLIFRAPISIGQSVTVTTALFDASTGQPTSISGVVVAARGKSDDDQWQVIVECNNMDAGPPRKPIFPLGYRFDYDNTTVTIG